MMDAYLWIMDPVGPFVTITNEDVKNLKLNGTKNTISRLEILKLIKK